MKLHDLKPAVGATTAPKRLGRGTGSSHWWSMAFAATMPAGMAQTPPPRVSVRSAPQRRGQILQSISRPSPVR